jgi:hypothetical protein
VPREGCLAAGARANEGFAFVSFGKEMSGWYFFEYF